eukprot:g2145.t1
MTSISPSSSSSPPSSSVVNPIREHSSAFTNDTNELMTTSTSVNSVPGHPVVPENSSASTIGLTTTCTTASVDDSGAENGLVSGYNRIVKRKYPSWTPFETHQLLLAMFDYPEIANEDKNWEKLVSLKFPTRTAGDIRKHWIMYIDHRLSAPLDCPATIPLTYEPKDTLVTEWALKARPRPKKLSSSSSSTSSSSSSSSTTGSSQINYDDDGIKKWYNTQQYKNLKGIFSEKNEKE